MTSAARLDAFLAAGGAALENAQGAMLGAEAFRMAITDVELEIKTTVDRDNDGALVLSPIGVDQIAARTVAADLVSTVKVRFTALADESTGERAEKNPAVVIDEVLRRPDVAPLAKLFGDLQMDAAYIPTKQQWLVTATDPEGRALRQVVVSDRTP